MGPVFGLKGGATGGGYSQIAPLEDINLHFTGDIHAITSANNLIASVIDNHIYWGNKLNIEKVTWKRCLDVNDRSLRNVEVQISKNKKSKTQFQISAASEIMAIFTLANSLSDLRERIENIIIGLNKVQKPIFIKDLEITGSIMAILKDAFKPNMVQTLENNPAFVHGGPFANIAHGCNSIIATKMALSLGDYVITEAGFGADLGAEKFLNIKTRQGKLNPNLVVIVATIKAIKLHGEVKQEDLLKEDLKALEKGVAILDKHISNLKGFNLNYVVALNEFASDKVKEKKWLQNWCTKNKHPFAFANIWQKGGNGGQNLAKLILENISNKKVHYTYEIEDTIKSKIEKIAKNIYGAQGVFYSNKALNFISFLEKNNLDKKYICIAKTPSSITDNPLLKGVNHKWKLNVENISLSNGAKLIVVECGKIMTMPGLSKKPRANIIDFDGKKILGMN